MEHQPKNFSLNRSMVYQRVLGIFAIFCIGFGTWGFWICREAEGVFQISDVFNNLYLSFQLLILHGIHVDCVVPWQLHVGRLFGILFLFTAGIGAFWMFFQNEILTLRLNYPWRKNHVVICGLGDLGLRLAHEARRRKRFVVAIEKKGEQTAIEQARKDRILVIEGDACEERFLKKARVERAEFVVACCNKDHNNVAIASQVRKIINNYEREKNTAGEKVLLWFERLFIWNTLKNKPLICRLLIQDHEIHKLLANESVFPRADNMYSNPIRKFNVNFQDLNLNETAARQCFSDYPLDFQPIGEKDSTIVHLVIAGFGPMGQNMALHAARIGHFANCGHNDLDQDLESNKKIKITIVDHNIDLKLKNFNERVCNFEKVTTLSTPKLDSNQLKHNECDYFVEVLDNIGKKSQNRSAENGNKELITYAICLEDKDIANDRKNLEIGLKLVKKIDITDFQTLIYQGSICGYAALFPSSMERGDGIEPNINPFGMVENIYTWDTLIHESEDRIACAIHNAYNENTLKTEGSSATFEKWEDLSDDFKDSNRQAADHIPIKLRACHFYATPKKHGDKTIPRFNASQMELLAKMEHLRWWAERLLACWKYAPETNKEKKENKYMVPWIKIESDPVAKSKDISQIEAIIPILYSLGFGVYRR